MSGSESETSQEGGRGMDSASSETEIWEPRFGMAEG